MTMSFTFEAFLEASPDAIVVVNQHGSILLVNGHTEHLFGYERADLVGRPVDVLVPHRFAGVHPRHRASFSADPHRRPMGAGLDLFGVRRDGTEFPVEISLSPLETDEGTVVISAVRDITDRKRLEDDVRRQSRMKSEFLANMSHELRTPLNSIIGFAELLHDGKLGAVAPQHREFLGDILTSARHLLQLINDVLDLSKVESGRMEFFPERVDLAALLVQFRDLVRTLGDRRLTVTLDVDPAAKWAFLDPAKLKQVLYNYVSNAIKFTPDGGAVTVRARPTDEYGVTIEVEDTGPGIREDDLSRLFVEFLQLDAGSSKAHGGTGLGLALTKRIVEAQGGSVAVRSVVGEGSCFSATFPHGRLEPPAAETSAT